MTIQDSLKVALERHRAGNFVEAQAIYRQILARHPDNPDALHLLGLLALQMGEPDRAIELISLAVTHSPRSAEFYINLGMAHEQTGRPERAVQSYEQAISLNPRLPQAFNNLSHALWKLGHFSPAIDAARQAVALVPNYAAAHNNLGNALLAAGEFTEAAEQFRKAIELQPAAPEVHANLAGALLVGGKIAESIAAARRAVEILPSSARALTLLGSALAAGEQFQEALACFHRALEIAPDHPEALANLGKSLHSLGLLEDAVAFLRRAAAAQPASASILMNLAMASAELGQFDEALRDGRRALELKPDDADLLSAWSVLLTEAGELEQALEATEQALNIRPDWPEAERSLSTLLRLSNRADEALASAHLTIEDQPNDASGFVELGLAQQELGEIDQAIAAYREATELDPQDQLAQHCLALALLAQGDFANAWPGFESRLRTQPFRMRLQRFTRPMWDGSSPEGKRILLVDEQGYGDNFQFIRYAPELHRRGAKLSLVCRPELVQLFSRVEGIDACQPARLQLPEHDAYCLLGSLPALFGTTLDSIPANVPYLSADAELARTWQSKMPQDNRLKVGLAWSGRHLPDPRRSVPAAALSPLGAVPNVGFFSLQIKAASHRRDSASPDFAMTDWTDELVDFSQTAALIANLDLVITIDSAVAHLAGAMGKPVWLLLKSNPDWRWLLDRVDSPWYPTMRLFRQPRIGDWSTPIAEVEKELRTFAQTPRR
jgi:tetratricopeptide (TPR) repeat protein